MLYECAAQITRVAGDEVLCIVTADPIVPKEEMIQVMDEPLLGSQQER
jgi:hypothetical protein